MESYNNDKLINGWYYDLQLDNRLSSITLHANKHPKGCSVPSDLNWTNENYDTWKEAPSEEAWENWTDGGDKYGKAPICTAILNEDFSVTAANNWSDFGGDMIGGIWGNVVQPLSPYAEEIAKSIHNLAEQNKSINESSTDTWGGKAKNAAMHAIDFLDEKLQNKKSITDYLRSALVVQGTRFTYYSGTGIAFSNLGMKFTVFPKWVEDKFISVIDQLLVIYPYFIGHLVDSKDTENQFAKDFIKWQRPPGDFTPNLKQIDEAKNNDGILDGTLKLNFGPYYTIRNLVGGDITLNFSKQMIKKPVNKEEKIEIEITPLYCDVTLTLKPATRYSDNALKGFIGGKDNKIIEETNKKINDGLNSVKESLNKSYSK